MSYATANSIMGAHCSGEYSGPYEMEFVPKIVAEVGNPRKFGIEAKRALRGQVTAYTLYSVISRTAIIRDDGFVDAGDIINDVDRRYVKTSKLGLVAFFASQMLLDVMLTCILSRSLLYHTDTVTLTG